VQVIGVPDERYGEELMAWVIPRAGAPLTEEDVKEFCRGKIAHFKIPRYVKFAGGFPMTVTVVPSIHCSFFSAMGSGRARAAEDRGAAMSLATAAEYALMLTDPGPPRSAPGPGMLSARERELVTLVAQGRTNAQIAAELHISVRTVSSHLDRVRDKTGCRRRADLTRLALSARLV
jgi:DNA-binding CsgD family transcriptional regulator